VLRRQLLSPGNTNKELEMGERIIITDEEPKPAPDVVVVVEQPKPKVERERVVTEKTIVVEEKEA
jgi:hypothetical protein